MVMPTPDEANINREKPKMNEMAMHNLSIIMRRFDDEGVHHIASILNGVFGFHRRLHMKLTERLNGIAAATMRAHIYNILNFPGLV